MTDPDQPTERGLRATVRMAAGINTGDRPEPDAEISKVALRLRGSLAAGFERLRGRLPGSEAVLGLGGSTLRHAFVGGTVGLGVVGCGFVGLAAQAALAPDQPPPPVEVAYSLVEPAAKADRLTIGDGTLAALATPSRGAGDLIITTRLPAKETTLAMPVLAYASADLRSDAVEAIDRVLEAPAIAAAPAAPVEASPEDEEDDEALVPLVLPMPRAKPDHDPIVLPLPRPRPMALASLAPPGVRVEADEAEAPAAAPRRRTTSAPADQQPPGVLGFFSTPKEPVSPTGKTTVETPFGVPYVLQTGSVETACLKPELVDVLRRIEGHYHEKVVITSGFRDRGRQGSLHRQCAAADIQVPGVGAAQLASFARTIPNIGGVGTYCHPNMIHVDIGTPRDWKYGCGSFFAMRGGTAHWGKVPGSLAKAQSGSGSALISNDSNVE